MSNIHQNYQSRKPESSITKFLPRWYVFVAGKRVAACSASARPALNIGIICKSQFTKMVKIMSLASNLNPITKNQMISLFCINNIITYCHRLSWINEFNICNTQWRLNLSTYHWLKNSYIRLFVISLLASLHTNEIRLTWPIFFFLYFCFTRVYMNLAQDGKATFRRPERYNEGL